MRIEVGLRGAERSSAVPERYVVVGIGTSRA